MNEYEYGNNINNKNKSKSQIKTVIIFTSIAYILNAALLTLLDQAIWDTFGPPVLTIILPKINGFLEKLHPYYFLNQFYQFFIIIIPKIGKYMKKKYPYNINQLSHLIKPSYIYLKDIYDSFILCHFLSKTSNELKRDIERKRNLLTKQYERKITKITGIGLLLILFLKMLFPKTKIVHLPEIGIPESIEKMYIYERVKKYIPFFKEVPKEKIEKNFKRSLREKVSDAVYEYRKCKKKIRSNFRRIFIEDEEKRY